MSLCAYSDVNPSHTTALCWFTPQTPCARGYPLVPPGTTSSAVQQDGGFQSCSSPRVGKGSLYPRGGHPEALRAGEHGRSFKPDARLPAGDAGALSRRHHLQLHFLINVLPNFPWLPALPLSVTLLITDVSLHRGKREEKLFFQGDSERGLYY